jgi:hypothetical protein
MGYYGYETGHYLKDVYTVWEIYKGQIGIMTSCSVETSKLPRETHKIYFKAINGNVYTSNLIIYSQMAGYRCKHSKDLNDNEQEQLYKSYSDWAKGLPMNNKATWLDLELIRDNVEGVGYILDKCIKNGIKGNRDLFNVLEVWQKHKEMEYVVAAGQWQLGLNKSFWKLTDNKKKQVINWVKHHKGEYTLGYILDDINGIDHELREFSQLHKLPYGITQEYFDKQMDICGYYPESKMRDYYKMCRELKKDLKDKYWLMPKDVIKAHDKVMHELNALKKAREKQERQDRNKIIQKLYKKYSKFSFCVGEYTISVPVDESDIIYQANKLNQCLITAGYDKKMASGQIILVFIKKEGKPIATMEVYKQQKRMGQFYTDESDRHECTPSQEIRALGEQWLENYKAA